MIVPEYWSEAKQKISHEGRQMTIRRFGWSDESEADAFEQAKDRVSEAIESIRAGGTVRLTDHKVPYNGAEGLPIREEVIDRHGDAVITRNSYGALCLNTPDVLFADVDVLPQSAGKLTAVVYAIILAIGGLLAWIYQSWTNLIWFAVIAWILGGAIARSILWIVRKAGSEPFDAARRKIEEFAARNPDWNLRVYRTPMGFRVLVMHTTFDPTEEHAFEFMKAIGSDKLYVRMCRNQKCFRARVSPKPWRIGIDHIKPRPGTWPIKPEKMSLRREWVRRYEQAAREFASCRFEAGVGSGRVHRKCEAVRSAHDRLCRSDTSLELA